ncbi:hypothetical protein K461DRAFT_283254 [Myriangium duriaei CBS 260.36]|uniref:Uncharacterized protein n=1 Tax=Myriangium duriaei CBS 260.36 TaxID=1168546 RepID=A0A9P4IPD8_9PEZI|nr:hypothetical protein K461DRAFT_283254 [Myriangium duriaei CBS 260.36]
MAKHGKLSGTDMKHKSMSLISWNLANEDELNNLNKFDHGDILSNDLRAHMVVHGFTHVTFANVKQPGSSFTFLAHQTNGTAYDIRWQPKPIESSMRRGRAFGKH